MSQELIAVAIDQGWHLTKTESNVFVSSVEVNPSPTFFHDVLEYEGVYYNIGGARMEVKNNKVEDDDFYLLALAAIAKELNKRGIGNKARIYLALGLPLTRFGSEKQGYIEYFMRKKEIAFKFEEKSYYIIIEKVSVYPQCYSAVIDMIPSFQRKVVVVDIGSWTIDIMPVVNKKPDDRRCSSLPKGVITCMRDINRSCVKLFNYELDESDIEHYIKFGTLSNIPQEVINVMDTHLKDYADSLLRSLKELGFNIMTTPIVIVGGGAGVIKRYCSQDIPNIQYNLDVKANAKGYATLARIALRNDKR